jgi:hypothetical protein
MGGTDGAAIGGDARIAAPRAHPSAPAGPGARSCRAGPPLRAAPHGPHGRAARQVRSAPAGPEPTSGKTGGWDIISNASEVHLSLAEGQAESVAVYPAGQRRRERNKQSAWMLWKGKRWKSRYCWHVLRSV